VSIVIVSRDESSLCVTAGVYVPSFIGKVATFCRNALATSAGIAICSVAVTTRGVPSATEKFPVPEKLPSAPLLTEYNIVIGEPSDSPDESLRIRNPVASPTSLSGITAVAVGPAIGLGVADDESHPATPTAAIKHAIRLNHTRSDIFISPPRIILTKRASSFGDIIDHT
jgi:hypothetical protein